MADYNSIHTGAQIDEGVGRALSGRAGINPNLLDNWYFGNPVNQRGKTEYTTSEGYTIDRWRTHGNATVTIGSDSLAFFAAGDANIVQPLENALKEDTLLTFSVLNKTGTLYARIRDAEWGDYGYAQVTGEGVATVTAVVPKGKIPMLQFHCEQGESVKVKAAKLELGTQQTLAHQDEAGNWVLNEIPNYAEELAKCQRYFYAFDFTDWAGVGAYWGRGISSTEIELYNLTFPVTMRINPALNNLKVYEDGSGNTYDVVPSSFFLKKEGLRRIDISSGMTAIEGRTYVVVKAWISAEL